ncbi:MAG: Tim44/TimA family putative adaptor protein [Dongiaceae bacterium]
MGSEYFDIIILAAIAVFLVMRLYRVLGRRTGHEQRRDPFGAPAEEARPDKVIPLPDRRAARPDEPAPESAAKPEPITGTLQAGLARIRTSDPGFDQANFVTGARRAFEMILTAFAAGDVGALRPLLNAEVLANFSNAVTARQQAKETLQSTLVAINSAELVEADLQERNAVVTVKFVSEQINVTRDAAGRIVDGDPAQVAVVTDIWTFSRNTRSRDLNWTLVATQSPN